MTSQKNHPVELLHKSYDDLKNHLPKILAANFWFLLYRPSGHGAPPDKSKPFSLIHVINKNDGIGAGNLWVPIIDQ